MKPIFITFLGFYFLNALFIANPIFISKCQSQEIDHKTSQQFKCVHVKSLILKGNSSFSDIRLKMRMKSWHSSLLPGNFNCYNEEWLKKDILALVEFYRKKGFPDVEIDYLIDTGAGDKNKYGEPGNKDDKYIVEINIYEGSKYDIRFTGNSFFSDRELKKKVDLVKKGNLNDTALGRARVDIQNIYLDAGFQDITVEFSKKLDGENISEKNFDNQNMPSDKSANKSDQIRIVGFTINEGVRMVVNRLEIDGNRRLSDDEIWESMLTRQKGGIERSGIGGYNPNVLDKDINAIELLYLGKGFLNAIVSKKIIINPVHYGENKKSAKIYNSSEADQTRQSPDYQEPHKISETKFVDISININEGVQTVVKSTQIKGLVEALSPQEKLLTPEEAMEQLSLRPGEPFREYMVKSDENALSMMISELGYPHVNFRGDVKFNSDKSTADLVWKVDKGKFTRFGNIHYSGNRRLKEDVIEKRLKIKSGEPFSLKKVFATEKQIRESSAVKYVQVKSPGLAQMEDSPDIEVVIEESKPYFVEAALGYDTEQSLYIDTKIGDSNFLGREIDAWVSANMSGVGYRGESGLKKPFFLGTEIDATGSIFVEDQEEMNKNFGIRAWGYESGFSRHLFIKNLIAGLNLKYENRTVYGDADIDIQEDETRNILVTSFAVGYDTRDSLVQPSKGFLSSCSVDVYTGFDSDLDKFLKYQIDFRKYLSPFDKLTFALRARMGYIQPFGSEDSVAQDQLFFLGGTPNVRGFKENMLEYDSNGDPTGGRSAINSTIEARVDLPADFELNLFWDTGKIDDISNSMDSRGFRSSLGSGLRYVTPIGPVGLLYGHKLNTEDGESPGRIHFSVGYTF